MHRPTQHFNIVAHSTTCFGSQEPSLGTSLYNLKNMGTFGNAITLFVRSHKVWLFIKVINVRHSYKLKYQDYDINKNKTDKNLSYSPRSKRVLWSKCQSSPVRLFFCVVYQLLFVLFDINYQTYFF